MKNSFETSTSFPICSHVELCGKSERKIAATTLLPLQIRYDYSICPVRFRMLMRLSILRSAVLFFSLPTCAFSAVQVVNLSHYDMMRPDFVTMKRQGIVGVIHE